MIFTNSRFLKIEKGCGHGSSSEVLKGYNSLDKGTFAYQITREVRTNSGIMTSYLINSQDTSTLISTVSMVCQLLYQQIKAHGWQRGFRAGNILHEEYIPWELQLDITMVFCRGVVTQIIIYSLWHDRWKFLGWLVNLRVWWSRRWYGCVTSCCPGG